MKKTILSGVVLAALTVSAAEMSKDWKIVYPDVKSGAADLGSEYSLRTLAQEILYDFEEATGWKLAVVPLSSVKPGTPAPYSFEKPQHIYGNGRWLIPDMPYTYANSLYPPGEFAEYGGHSFHEAVPAEFFKTHPEYFGMDKGGKRLSPGSCRPYCLSNPGRPGAHLPGGEEAV